MAPQSRPQARHAGSHQSAGRSATNAPDAPEDGPVDDELFIDPMLGTLLAIYIEKDVAGRDNLVEIITKYGGQVSPGYSGVPYILVDPHGESGQSLYRQYAGKKGKIVLDARWIHECVRAKELQTFHTNWAGCKVTGKEQVGAAPVAAAPPVAPTTNRSPIAPRRGRPPGSLSRPHVPGPTPAQPQPQPPHQQHQTHQSHQPHQPPPLPNFAHPQSLQAPQAQAPPQVIHPGPLPPPNFQFPVYAPQTPQHPGGRPTMQAPPSAPPQTWQTPNGIPAHVTHAQMIAPRPQNLYPRDDQWDGPTFPHLESADVNNTLPAINGGQPDSYYDQRYRNDQNGWPDSTPGYYDQPPYVPYPPEPPHQQQQQQQPEPPFIPQTTGSSAQPQDEANLPSNTGPERQQRGRKRTRTQPPPAPPASTLVLNRRHPPARSPTPPTRVIKSTYGGNLFTADDVLYLKKYIDYCQEQGLVLSLREICERIAVKAPHHTFYSWRRYCNKHQIRLGGYAMDIEGNTNRSMSPGDQNDPGPSVMGMSQVQGAQAVQNMQGLSQGVVPSAIQGSAAPKGDGPFTVNAAMRALQEGGLRARSPTPPRALFRSTTGKGVAFTDEDVAFLCKMLAHRKMQGRLDMVTFWKDVANKAQHHSRASWMKYYRRHKHELNRIEGDEPLPPPPAKKMRYGKNDDVLLARYFANKPEGTSDKIFQEFAKVHPHHPWKGWQEHHRIHKAKIDHLIQRINSGETIEIGDDDD